MMTLRFSTAACLLLAVALAGTPLSPSFAQSSDTSSKPAAKPKPAPTSTKKPAEKPAAKPADKKQDTAKPAAPAAKPSPSAGATMLGQFGDWGAYTATPNGKKICFALAKPSATKSDKPVKERGEPYLFISTRPAEKVKDEVSVIIGYPFKADSDASVEIGSASFVMSTQNDGAWIKNAADEGRMVETMRKGSDLVIKGESGRGTRTTDTYSLKGLEQALSRVSQECK